MKKLNYKGVTFDSFAFSNDDSTKYIDESNVVSLEEFQGGGWGYICPECIKKHGLYAETDLTENEVESEIVNKENRYGYDGIICCVDGCNNLDACDINFKTDMCELV